MLYYIPPKQKMGSGPSANSITAIKDIDNLKKANTTMPSIGDFQPWNRFTYILRASKCQKTIRKRTCSHETGSLTTWEQANATRLSAREPAAMKQVHLHTESRKMWQDYQQDLQPWHRFTYSLGAGKCDKTISKRSCNHETGTLTPWEQENVTRPSAKMTCNHETHSLALWEQENVTRPSAQRTCSHETGSLTVWEQENTTRPSARGAAAMKEVHLHTESMQMPQDHQQEDMQLWNMFTYFLRAGKYHKAISKRICSHETGSLTYWEQEHVTRPSAKGPATMKQVHLHTEST